MKMSGRRPDGSTLHAQNGKPVYGAYFQQSSFGNFAIANEKFAVKVPDSVPIEMLGPLACGGQTGAGAVLNVMKPAPGDSFGVFGVGSVGLSGLMAAKIAGCDPIIAVDVHEHGWRWRANWARPTPSTTRAAPTWWRRSARSPVRACASRWRPRRSRRYCARRSRR